MKKIFVFSVGLLMLSGATYGEQSKVTLGDVEICQAQLQFLKIVADEQCRKIPGHLYEGGSGEVFFLLHPGECRSASDEVIQKAHECLRNLSNHSRN